MSQYAQNKLLECKRNSRTSRKKANSSRNFENHQHKISFKGMCPTEAKQYQQQNTKIEQDNCNDSSLRTWKITHIDSVS